MAQQKTNKPSIKFSLILHARYERSREQHTVSAGALTETNRSVKFI